MNIVLLISTHFLPTVVAAFHNLISSSVVNGSWNNWAGWGVTLVDTDNDGIFTGGLELPPFTTFEYVVAVTGAADGWSGWGMQWGDGCANSNVIVTTGEDGSVTETSLTAGCGEVLGCLDQNACNYNQTANTDDDSCLYADLGYDCLGNCLDDENQDGICDDTNLHIFNDLLASVKVYPNPASTYLKFTFNTVLSD